MARALAPDATVDTQDPAPQEVAPESSRLRPDVNAQLMRLQRGDANGLAQLLAQYPEQRQQILEAAAQRLGNSTVQHALAMEDFREVNEEPADAYGGAIGRGAPPSAENAAGAMADFREVNEAPAPKQESAWVTAARAWNTEHAELAEQFNALTKGACAGADGQLDPAKLSDWQAAHGVSPDGRIGPHTLAAAKQADPADPISADPAIPATDDAPNIK